MLGKDAAEATEVRFQPPSSHYGAGNQGPFADAKLLRRSLALWRVIFGSVSFAPGLQTADMASTRKPSDFRFGFGAVAMNLPSPVHDEALLESLQGEIFPRRAAIIRMCNGRIAVVFEIFSRNEEDENGGVLRPGFISFHE